MKKFYKRIIVYILPLFIFCLLLPVFSEFLASFDLYFWSSNNKASIIIILIVLFILTVIINKIINYKISLIYILVILFLLYNLGYFWGSNVGRTANSTIESLANRGQTNGLILSVIFMISIIMSFVVLDLINKLMKSGAKTCKKEEN